MYIYVCIFICLVSGSLGTEDTNKAEVRASRKNFFLSSDVANTFQAYFNCKESGMDLVSLESQEDEEELSYFLGKVDKTKGFWLSATNLANVNTTKFYWLTGGKRAIYTNWFSGEPNNSGGVENCVQWAERSGVLGWNDYNCQHELQYICQDQE